MGTFTKNFPYRPTLTFTTVQGKIRKMEIYGFSSLAFNSSTVASTYEMGITEIPMFRPSTRESADFSQNEGVRFGSDNLFYTVKHENTGTVNETYTINIHTDAETIIDSAVLNVGQLSSALGYNYDNVNIYNMNLYCLCPNGRPIGWGVAVCYGAYNGDNYVNNILYAPLNNEQFWNNIVTINDIENMNEYGENIGQIELTLDESNNFQLCQLPGNIFQNKQVYDQSNFWKDIIIPIIDPNDENYDESYTLYQNNGAFCGYFSSSGWSSYGNPQKWTSTGAVVNQAITYYDKKGYKIGSDMLRKKDGQFYNGNGLSASDRVVPLNQTDDPYYIKFKSGYIKISYEQTASLSPYWIEIQDNEHNTVGSRFRLPVDNTTGSNGYIGIDSPYTGYQQIIYNLYLAEYNGEYYLLSLWKGKGTTDDEGNTIRYYLSVGTYNEYCQQIMGFYILHKFENEQNELLNESLTMTVNYNDENIDENSDAGSLSDEMSNNYDKESKWRKGDNAGSNEGMRYNGSNNTDSSDLEKTRADDIPGGQAPEEDPNVPGFIPTPINTGMINALAPTPGEMKTFSSILNSDSFLQIIKNYFTNPMDIVISAHTCYTPSLITGDRCYLKYGTFDSSTIPLSMLALSKQYYDVDMGYLNLTEIQNSFADYPPVSKYSIYLPYIGTREIDGRIIMGREIFLTYHIDVLTGDILAELFYYDSASNRKCPIGLYNGNTLSRFPLKSTDYSSMINGSISGVFGTASAVAQMTTGNVTGGLITGINAIGNTAKSLSHPEISVNGSISGSLTRFSYDTPYIIQQAPHFYNKLPLNYNRVLGMPSNIGTTIGNILTEQSEFISFIKVDINNIKNPDGDGATEEEKIEIENILKGGIYTK